MEQQREPLLGQQELYEIGDNIRNKRKERNWTQEDLAGHMESDHRVVSRHESGSGMDLEMLLRYAHAFGCSPTALLPQKFRIGELSASLMEVLVLVAAMPSHRQDIVAEMIKTAMKLNAA